MSNADSDRIERYLADVSRQLADMPRSGREGLIADLREHIREAQAIGSSVDDVLDGLGDPGMVAMSAVGDGSPAAATDTAGNHGLYRWWTESTESRALTAVLIAVGGAGFLLFARYLGVFWILGMALLWPSPRWSTRIKLVATLGIPVTYLVIDLLRVVRWVTTEDCSTSGDCHLQAPGLMIVLGWVLLAACVAAAAVSVLILMAHARGRGDADPSVPDFADRKGRLRH